MMKAEHLERVFEEFQHDGVVENEKFAVVGMAIRYSRLLKDEEMIEILDCVERLVQHSERQGFKYGFKMAMLLIGKRGSNPVTSIEEYLRLNEKLEKH